MGHKLSRLLAAVLLFLPISLSAAFATSGNWAQGPRLDDRTQVSQSLNMASTSNAVTLALNARGDTSITITGLTALTTGQVIVETTGADGTTWSTKTCRFAGVDQSVTMIDGKFNCTTTGDTQIRIRPSTTVSGSITVSLNSVALPGPETVAKMAGVAPSAFAGYDSGGVDMTGAFDTIIDVDRNVYSSIGKSGDHCSTPSVLGCLIDMYAQKNSAIPDTYESVVTITATDAGTSTASGFDSQSQITGTPTTNSFQQWLIDGAQSVDVLVYNYGGGTLQYEGSKDSVNCPIGGGGTYANAVFVPIQMRVRGITAPPTATTTNNVEVYGSVAGFACFRVRATSAESGTLDLLTTFSNYSDNVLTGTLPPFAAEPPVSADLRALQGGVETQLGVCKSYNFINVSSSANTQLVALTSGKVTEVCGYKVFSSGTNQFTLEYSASNSCTSPTAMDIPIPVSATVPGIVDHASQFYQGIATPSSDALCGNSVGTGAMGVGVWYDVHS